MSYLVLARKCRPGRFDEVVGQGHVTRTLANAIRMNRVAHGFLFSGVRGVGKTSLARILAKSLNCKEGPTETPCGVCESCRSITDGTAVDVIEIDGASNNSVDDIRELRESVPYRPIIGRYKIYVIDEVHMLSVSAFNALLKTLEEPPPHVKFVFATTEPHKIPATILSRIQRYDFRRISTAAIVERIQTILRDEGIEAEDAAVAIVGREAEGSMRDALSILDQILAAGETRITAQSVTDLLGIVGRQVYFDLSSAVIDGRPGDALKVIQDLDRQGFDIPVFTRGLLEHFRNLMVTALCGEDTDFLDLAAEELDSLRAQARSTHRNTLHRILKHLSEACEDIARSAFPRILLEAVVARLADAGELLPASTLLDKLNRLETTLRSGTLAPAGGGAGGSPASQAATPHRSAKNTTGQTRTASSTSPAKMQPEPAPLQSEPSNPTSAAGATPILENSPLSSEEWQRWLEQLSANLPARASLLERAVLDGRSTRFAVRLQFDQADQFSVSQVMEKDFTSSVEATLQRILGHPLTLAVELCALESGTESTLAGQRLRSEAAQRKKEETVRNHPLVRGLETAMNATITRIQFP
jgi:DNA polymerase III subunit gamma/tau